MDNEKIVGYWTLSNHGGLSVVSISDDGDSMIVRWYEELETSEHEIIYEVDTDNSDSDELEACIDYHGTLYWLRDCMRVN